MNTTEILHCTYCKYTTNRNYNLNRHQINKHSKEIIKNIISTPNILYNSQNNNLSGQNNNLTERNNNLPEQNNNLPEQNNNSNNLKENNNETDNKMCCKKCNKKYSTNRYLKKHENKCIGINILTCPKCRKSFSSRQHKCDHIKRNTCKPKIEIIEVIENIETKKYKKQPITATMKRLVWNENIGEEFGKSKCLCCNTTDITQLSFNCGHVVAEANGGETIVSNLRPICQNCNLSMRTTNMNDFMKLLK